MSNEYHDLPADSGTPCTICTAPAVVRIDVFDGRPEADQPHLCTAHSNLYNRMRLNKHMPMYAYVDTYIEALSPMGIYDTLREGYEPQEYPDRMVASAHLLATYDWWKDKYRVGPTSLNAYGYDARFVSTGTGRVVVTNAAVLYPSLQESKYYRYFKPTALLVMVRC